jgi:hypothetical protein
MMINIISYATGESALGRILVARSISSNYTIACGSAYRTY